MPKRCNAEEKEMRKKGPWYPLYAALCLVFFVESNIPPKKAIILKVKKNHYCHSNAPKMIVTKSLSRSKHLQKLVLALCTIGASYHRATPIESFVST